MRIRRMGIDEVKDIEHGNIVDASEIDGQVKCFYCHKTIESEGLAGKGSWMFHKHCYSAHADSIAEY